MKKYLLIFVAVLVCCLHVKSYAQEDGRPSLVALEQERDFILGEVKMLQENTLERVRTVSPAVADRLVYSMHQSIQSYASRLTLIAQDIEFRLSEGRDRSVVIKQISKRRIPYERVGFIYDGFEFDAVVDLIDILPSEQMYRRYYPYISEELKEYISLDLVHWIFHDEIYLAGITQNSSNYTKESSYIAGLEKYIKKYPKSPYLLMEHEWKYEGESHVSEVGIVPKYNDGVLNFVFGSLPEDMFDEYNLRGMKHYLGLLPNGNLSPLIKRIFNYKGPRLQDGGEENVRLMSDFSNKCREFFLDSLQIRVPKRTASKLTALQGEQVRGIAQKTGKELVQLISPMSGSDMKFEFDLTSVIYDSKENVISVRVIYTWQARDLFSGVPYGECQMSGLLTVYPPIRSIDGLQAKFYYDERNWHLRRVSNEAYLNKLVNGYRVEM